VEWSWSKKRIVPLLAESWSNPDNHTWLFKLKKGVKFHDGSEFTSADVVHSFTRIQKDVDSKQASSIAHIDGMEAVDPYTVRLHTKTPDAALPFRLAQRFITNKAAYDRLGAAKADRLALGTGPYKLKDWVRGQWFVPMAWLYQYQGLQGVSNQFDFKANPGEDVYAWDLKPRLR
jgi:ABC-type transport system substrate-binding protein